MGIVQKLFGRPDKVDAEDLVQGCLNHLVRSNQIAKSDADIIQVLIENEDYARAAEFIADKGSEKEQPDSFWIDLTRGAELLDAPELSKIIASLVQTSTVSECVAEPDSVYKKLVASGAEVDEVIAAMRTNKLDRIAAIRTLRSLFPIEFLEAFERTKNG